VSSGHYVGVPIPSVVYVGCPDKEEFDKIGAPVKDHGPNEQHGGAHVLTKCVEGPGAEPGRPVKVIFQHWLVEEPVEHMVERHRREKAEREAAQIIVENARCSRCGAKLDGSDECSLAECPHV
jgi:hypothetical protein